MDNNNSIKKSYERITPFFHGFSKHFESKARIKSLELSGLENGNSVLIIAPPTEFYIERLLTLNSDGENHLICFSEHLKERVEERFRRRFTFVARVGNPEKLPYEKNKFDVIFAYCYLDFLDDQKRTAAAEEIRRVLKLDGRLLATYLAPPSNVIQRIFASFFTWSDFLSKGVRVVELEPVLKQTNFKNIQRFYCPQKGLPIALAYAEK